MRDGETSFSTSWRGGGREKGGMKEGDGKEMKKIFPLNRLFHSREWKKCENIKKIIAETFGGECESSYLCTRNRERCGFGMVGRVPAGARLRLESPSETPDPGEDEKIRKKLHEKFGG